MDAAAVRSHWRKNRSESARRRCRRVHSGRLENSYSCPFPFARFRAFQHSRSARRKMPRVVRGNPGRPANSLTVNQLRMTGHPCCALPAAASTIRPVPARPDGLRFHANRFRDQLLGLRPGLLEYHREACSRIAVVKRKSPHGPASLAQSAQNIGRMPVAARRFFLCHRSRHGVMINHVCGLCQHICGL